MLDTRATTKTASSKAHPLFCLLLSVTEDFALYLRIESEYVDYYLEIQASFGGGERYYTVEPKIPGEDSANCDMLRLLLPASQALVFSLLNPRVEAGPDPFESVFSPSSPSLTSKHKGLMMGASLPRLPLATRLPVLQTGSLLAPACRMLHFGLGFRGAADYLRHTLVGPCRVNACLLTGTGFASVRANRTDSRKDTPWQQEC